MQNQPVVSANFEAPCDRRLGAWKAFTSADAPRVYVPILEPVFVGVADGDDGKKMAVVGMDLQGPICCAQVDPAKLIQVLERLKAAIDG